MTHNEFLLQKIRQDFQLMADPERAAHAQGFFKTAPGEYGEGDLFLGIRMPDIRDYEKRMRPWSLELLELLLQEKEHELRMLALVALCHLSERSKSITQRQRILEIYLKHTQYVNNWDLVDASAPRIVGYYLATWTAEQRADLLDKLARSGKLWEQRIAMVANWGLIRRGIYDDTIRIAEILLTHKHDLIHKALGWMLRELAKKDMQRYYAFLDKHAATMPRTALRYAIELLGPQERDSYLERKNQAP